MSSELLNLASLDDAQFQRLYAERIAPCFISNEADRQAGVATLRRRALIGAPVLLALVISIAVLFQSGGFAIFSMLAGGFGLAWWAMNPLNEVSARVKRLSLSAIADAMGASFMLGGFEPPAFARFETLKLLPGHNRSHFEDWFRGRHRGAEFDLYEAHLQQHRSNGKNSSTVTVFRGQVIRLAFPRKFLGLTIVRRDAGVFNAFGAGDGLKRVGLVDPKFEKVFEVFSNDQVEARYLVHPVFMERLMELETALNGKKLRCAFQDGDLLIAIEGGNLFEPGSMFQPLADPARARRIVDEIASVMRVMDAVLTAQADPRR